MSILDSGANAIASVGDFFKNPFSKNVETSIRPDDFPRGLEMEEQGPSREKIRLPGNLLPEGTFPFGGEHRHVKEFYPGNSEPVFHLFGPSESDITVNGRLWDKLFPADAFGKRGIAFALAGQLEEFRIRGNLLKIKLGEIQRFGFLVSSSFDMRDLANIRYQLTFAIVGFNPPLRSQFAGETIEPPLATNKELNDLLDNYNASQVPEEMPQSLGDILNGAISDVAGLISTVTGAIDDIITSVEEVEGSVNRAIGIVKNAETFMLRTKRRVGRIGYTSATLVGIPVRERYLSIEFIAAQMTFYASFLDILRRLRAQFQAIALTVPLARHVVRKNETLQKLASKFYDDDTQWKRIFDHNKLTSTDLTVGAILEIPRI